MKRTSILAFMAILGLAGPAASEITSEDIERYFEDELGNRDVLTEYKSRAEMELQFFRICARSSDFKEAMEAREAGVMLQQKRKALREQIVEHKDKNRDAFNMLTLTTSDIVEAAYDAQRMCVAHAANLKYLDAVD